VKPLVEISIPHYESLLKYASETSPLYRRLKNAVKTEENTIAILCDPYEAEMLHAVAKHFCPNAVPQIEKAIRLAALPLPPDLRN
jgi:hypothetical protein